MSPVAGVATTVAVIFPAATPLTGTTGEGAPPARVVPLVAVDSLFSSSSSFIDGSLGGAEIEPLF